MKAIEIPKEIYRDRAVIALVTQWRNCHLRYRECNRRVNWKNEKASRIEKKRRKEKWQIVARVLEIERTLLRWTGKATKHPDLFADKTHESRREMLLRRYYTNVRNTHNLVGIDRDKMMRKREKIVTEIRQLNRDWMSAIFAAVFPEKHVPRAIQLHPRELYPRKLKKASKNLAQELAVA